MPLPLAVALAHARLVTEAVRTAEVEVPESANAAYAIQDELAELISSPVVGYKIGATSEAAQQLLKLKAPISGRVHENTLVEANTTLDATTFHSRPGIECEFALRIRNDLPPSGPTVNATEARALVASVHPAIELVGTRYDDGFGVAPALLVADGSAHCTLVIGDPVDVDTAGDLAAATCRLVLDGDEVARGDGSAVLGDPYAALAWLINHLRGRGLGLPAGSIVTTGSCTGIVPSDADQTIVNDAGPLGSVSITIRG